MGATKIINVLKDDRFEELLDMAIKTDASEVIFILPKKTKAFGSEAHFEALEKEAKRTGKTVAFLCSSPEVNELARRYNFDVLSPRSNNPHPKPVKKEQRAVPVLVKKDGLNVNDDLEEDESIEKEPGDFDEELEPDKEEDKSEEMPEEDEKDTESEEPPYGTEADDEGNIVYDEEEGAGESIASNGLNRFPIITASAKNRGMGDILRPSTGKNLKIAQKNRKPANVGVHKSNEDDIQSVWGPKRSKDIWSDIVKPNRVSKLNFFNKLGTIKKTVRVFKSAKKGAGLLAVISLLVLAFVVYMTAGSAEINIQPRSQELSTQLKITISPNFSSVDGSFNRIPGQLFTINKSASDEFNSTAEKDAVQKSRGEITIYNEYGTSSQPLVATTRFELIKEGKETGLVFRALKTVTVPGMKVENGVVTAGKTKVEVIADKAGQTYNIPAGNFGVVAWREKGDTARYQKIYGKSSESMHGGILGKAKIVSEFDYNNAKDQLTTRVKQEIDELLKSQSAGLELVTSIESKVDTPESTAQIDDAAEKFTMTINGSIVTVGFKKEDLFAFISQYINRTSNLMIVADKLELSYKNASINTGNNALEVIVGIGGKAYAKIDEANIAANLMGRNETQIKEYLGSIKDIDSAKVVLSPFWVKKIPKNKDKVNIFLTY